MKLPNAKNAFVDPLKIRDYYLLHLIDKVPIDRMLSLLDAVALTAAIPGLNLVPGQVGTIVELLGDETFEVEFCDDKGKTYAMAAISASSLIALRYGPVAA